MGERDVVVFFDIFKVDKEGPVWRSSADTLDKAKERVQEFGKIEPGEYLIFNSRTGESLRISTENADSMSRAPYYVRCGSPGCKWQIALIDVSESESERLRQSFREHCIEAHALAPDDIEREAWFDLTKHTITLMGK
jgi:hypothetical protein